MKIPRMATAMGYLDGDLVASACRTEKKRRPAWQKWGSLAACLAVILASILVIPTRDNGDVVILGGIERRYKDITVSGGELDIDWPWEYKTVCEKYPTVYFAGEEYRTRAREIGEALLGEAIGTCEGVGYDIYQDKTYTESFAVRRIRGVEEDRLVAVEMEGAFYVYMGNTESRPATLGGVLAAYDLTNTLTLDRFSLCEGYEAKGYYTLADDGPLWELLSVCGQGEAVPDGTEWHYGGRRYVSFTVSSEALGAHRLAFCITEDGYVNTNLFGFRYLYFIGEEAARRLIAYATENGEATEPVPYGYTLSGTLTEIGDGYLRIDDSVLCAEESEGMVFKVLTEDLRIRRCVECADLSVGDTVVVRFTGEIRSDADHTVEGAYSLYPGTLIDGDLVVPE